MNEIVTSLNQGVTAGTLAAAIPEVGPMFLALIIFSIGLMIFRRVLRGARSAKPKV